MFEFAYFDRYTDPFSFQGHPTGQELHQLINHHIRVLAIAHKYCIRTLQACVIAKLDRLLTAGEHEYWDPGRWNAEVLGYLVKQLYCEPSVLDALDTESRLTGQLQRLTIESPQQHAANEHAENEGMDEDEDEYEDSFRTRKMGMGFPTMKREIGTSKRRLKDFLPHTSSNALFYSVWRSGAMHWRMERAWELLLLRSLSLRWT